VETTTASILIVDDAPILRQVARRALTQAGHAVIEAGNGEEALQIAREAHPDIILLDVVLPDISGIDLCQRLRADPAFEQTGILLISGHKTASLHQTRGLDAGADGYVTRPIPNRELVARVEALLRMQQTAAALERERDLVRRVMTTSPVALVVVDDRGAITYANPSAEALLGPIDHVITDPAKAPPPWEVTDQDGNPVPTDQLIYQRVMATKAPVSDTRHRITWPDGTYRIVATSGAPIFNAEGDIESAVLALDDVTGEVQYVDHIAHFNRVLDAIRTINQMLVRARDRRALIRQVCDQLVSGGIATSSWIALTDPAGGLKAIASAGRSLERPELRRRIAASPLAAALDPTTEREVADLPRAAVFLSAPEAEGADAAVEQAITLIHQDRCYGILGLALPGTDTAYPDSTTTLIEEVAADIAFALYNLHRDAELQARTRAERAQRERLHALIKVGEALTRAPTVDDLCRSAVEQGIEALGFERLSIWLHNEDGSDTMRGTWGVDDQGRLHDERERRTPLDENDLYDWNVDGNVQIQQLEHVPLDGGDGAMVGAGNRVRALMWDNDEFIGLLSADNLLSGAPFTPHDTDTLGLFATFICNAIVKRRAADELQARERFYRTLFETTGTATMVLGPDMRPVVVNAQAEAIFGYTADELKAMRVATYVTPEHRELVEQRHRGRRIDAEETPKHYEIKMRTKSGQVRDILVDVDMIPGTDQSIASFSDITAQRNAIAEMRQRAAQQTALNSIITHTTVASDIQDLLTVTVQHLQAAIDVTAIYARIRDAATYAGPERARSKVGHCNSALDRYEYRQVIQVSDWQQIEDDADRPEMPPGLSATAREMGIRAMLWAPILDSATGAPIGGLCCVDQDPRGWTDAETALIEAIAQQISTATERLDLLQQVRREVEKLQTVIDAVPEGVVLLGLDHQVLLANPVAEEHLALLSNAGSGEPLHTLGDRPIDDLLKPPRRGAQHQVTAAGRTFEILAQPLAHTHALEGWVVIGRDITEELLAERQQRQQEQLAAVGRLASGIAHDFNNILAIIVLYAQMATRQIGLAPNTREQLQVIAEQAHRATDLIGQILDFSRSAPLTRQKMNLEPYVKEIIKLWERTLPESIRFELTYQPGDYTIEADPTRIQQTLMNLATNARDAMPQGGVVDIELRTATFTEADRPLPQMASGPWIQLTFADTGEGIPDDVLPYVFEPFFTTKDTGSGLGLSQVHGIVRQHEGEVTIESEVGVGTTVTLYLPAAGEVDEADERRPVQTEATVGGGETILLVEDNMDTSAALLAAMEDLNYTPLAAENGRHALDILEERGNEIDIIITDAIMPEMGARGLLTELERREDPHPVLVLSGYVQPEDQGDLRASPNLVAWLTKPVDLQNLATAIKLALDRR
jgi:two-component system, cell cycle sensor histidine kinase and response regulator CckA